MVQMREAFPEVPAGGLVVAAGKVSLLMGQDNLSLFPSERKRIGNAALYMSRFGTVWIASGRPPRAKGGRSNRHMGVCIDRTIGHEPVESVSRPEPQQENTAICAVSTSSHQWVAPPPLHVEEDIFQPSDFLSAESMGTDLPQVYLLPEMQGMQVQNVLADLQGGSGVPDHPGGSQVQHGARKMVGHVPIPHPAVHSQGELRPSVQVHLCPGEEAGQTGADPGVQQGFYKTIERGVFEEISPEKMAAWDGPINYMSMVEAFKEGPHSTTPLRICMNSSLKQPKPVSLSLNDCLVKRRQAGRLVHSDPVHP